MECLAGHSPSPWGGSEGAGALGCAMLIVLVFGEDDGKSHKRRDEEALS